MKSRSRFNADIVLILCSVFFHIFIFQIIMIFLPVWAWGGQGGMQSTFSNSNYNYNYNSNYNYQEVLVRYRSEATLSDIGNSYQTLGLNEVTYSPYSGLRRVRVPSTASVYSVSASLNQNPLVDFAEPNYIRRVNFIPNDPLYSYQWHLNNPMMQQTWDQSLGANIIVAVFDTGIAYRNAAEYAIAPDLAETNFIPGYDFVNDDPYPDDDNRHGTHTAGIIAQSTNNFLGGAGVAPECILMPVKVLDDTGSGSVADIVDAIYFAVNNGVQIINMSYGFVTSPSASEEEAIDYAVSQGIAVICSAGNEATSEPHYPSSYESTICVTASRYDHSFADSYSNYGPDVDICAPGGDLDEDLNGDGNPDGIYQQTHNGTDYKSFDFYFAEGTSCSAAFVSGVAALVLSRAARPLTPLELRQILQDTATDFGDPGWDQFFGWGLINPLAAVQAAVTYSTASSFGIRIGSQSLNTFNLPFNNPYQSSNTSVNININPSRVQGTATASSYQANAGFTTNASQIGQGIQSLNTALLSSFYAPSGSFFQNNWSYFNPIINLNPIGGNNLLSNPYFLAGLFIPQNYFFQPQQSTSGNIFPQSSSGSYQLESTIAGSSLPLYSSQVWNNQTIASSLIPSLTNALFLGSLYPFRLF
ncbi:MAG: S8 family serine peptidase [bacterium]